MLELYCLVQLNYGAHWKKRIFLVTLISFGCNLENTGVCVLVACAMNVKEYSGCILSHIEVYSVEVRKKSISFFFTRFLSIKFAHQTGCMFWTMRLFAGMDFHELLDIPHGDRRKYHDDVTVMVVSLEGRIWKSSGKYLWENIRSTKTTCKLQRKLEYDRFVWELYDLPSDAMRNQRDDDGSS